MDSGEICPKGEKSRPTRGEESKRWTRDTGPAERVRGGGEPAEGSEKIFRRKHSCSCRQAEGF